MFPGFYCNKFKPSAAVNPAPSAASWSMTLLATQSGNPLARMCLCQDISSKDQEFSHKKPRRSTREQNRTPRAQGLSTARAFRKRERESGRPKKLRAYYYTRGTECAGFPSYLQRAPVYERERAVAELHHHHRARESRLTSQTKTRSEQNKSA